MAGAATNFFTGQKIKYQQVIESAQTAQAKMNAAIAALTILAKPTIEQADAESLIALYEQTQ